MPMIGVRELRERTADVLRQVRELRTEYIITYQGRPVALLLPIDSKLIEAAMIQAGRQSISGVGGWETYTQLVEQLSRDWPREQATQNLLDEIRR
ncbi:MAG: hypothetical protein A2Z04_06090 [Chloroflexi bacterium RBG_16_57_9]|nr:MAG: hypothetical protein A2Z04_06090 [Chloroflexi bacterium RBG_16_57_9]